MAIEMKLPTASNFWGDGARRMAGPYEKLEQEFYGAEF
jgi:hypothetical protein